MRSSICRATLVALSCVALGLFAQAPPRVQAASPAYSFNWNGTPSAPTSWNPSTGFDLVVHDIDFTQTFQQPHPFPAQHGSDCGPFLGYGVGGTHMVTQYADEVFICNNHLMISSNGGGYSEITFTPAAMLDWSQGTATATWQVSTLRTSCRDWLSYNLMPFIDNLALTDGIGVDLYHEPRNELFFTTSASCPSNYLGYDVRNFGATQISGAGGSVEDVVANTPAAAKNRQVFELDVSSKHIRFGMPTFGKWFVDSDLASPLPYSQAVFQIADHSYAPDKECDPTPTYCHANTWHFSNLSMSNDVPFSILRGDTFQVYAQNNVVHFPGSAPANSYLRMEEVSARGSMTVTTNTGQVIPITRQQVSQDNPNGNLDDGRADVIFMPIPAGTTSLRFSAQDTYWTQWIARNISIWSTSPEYSKPVVYPPSAPGAAPASVGQGSPATAAPGRATGPGESGRKLEPVTQGQPRGGVGTSESRMQPLVETVAFVRDPAHRWSIALFGGLAAGLAAGAVGAVLWIRHGPPLARRRRGE